MFYEAASSSTLREIFDETVSVDDEKIALSVSATAAGVCFRVSGRSGGVLGGVGYASPTCLASKKRKGFCTSYLQQIEQPPARRGSVRSVRTSELPWWESIEMLDMYPLLRGQDGCKSRIGRDFAQSHRRRSLFDLLKEMLLECISRSSKTDRPVQQNQRLCNDSVSTGNEHVGQTGNTNNAGKTNWKPCKHEEKQHTRSWSLPKPARRKLAKQCQWH